MNQLSGSVKVAILTNAIGIRAARPILERLDEEERKLIFKLQQKLGSVPQPLVEKVAMEFLEFTGVPLIGDESKTDKKEKEENEEAPVKKSVKNLSAIQNIESNQLLQLIKDEHPQTIALILVHLKPAVASDILSMLQDEVKSDVAFRIDNLDKVMSGMVEEI
jgi:flagellar motor switch protein FliG